MQYEYLVRELGAGGLPGRQTAVGLEATLNNDPVQADGWELWQVANRPGVDGALLLLYRRDRRTASAE